MRLVPVGISMETGENGWKLATGFKVAKRATLLESTWTVSRHVEQKVSTDYSRVGAPSFRLTEHSSISREIETALSTRPVLLRLLVSLRILIRAVIRPAVLTKSRALTKPRALTKSRCLPT